VTHVDRAFCPRSHCPKAALPNEGNEPHRHRWCLTLKWIISFEGLSPPRRRGIAPFNVSPIILTLIHPARSAEFKVRHYKGTKLIHQSLSCALSSPVCAFLWSFLFPLGKRTNARFADMNAGLVHPVGFSSRAAQSSGRIRRIFRVATSFHSTNRTLCS